VVPPHWPFSSSSSARADLDLPVAILEAGEVEAAERAAKASKRRAAAAALPLPVREPPREPSALLLRRSSSSTESGDDVSTALSPISSRGLNALSPSRGGSEGSSVRRRFSSIPLPPAARRGSGARPEPPASPALAGVQSLFEGLGFSLGGSAGRPSPLSPRRAAAVASPSPYSHGSSPRAGSGPRARTQSFEPSPVLRAFLSAASESESAVSSSALGRAPSRLVYLDDETRGPTAHVSAAAARTKLPPARLPREPASPDQVAVTKWRAVQAQRRASFESEPRSPGRLLPPGTVI
jgi:hypothetical protein